MCTSRDQGHVRKCCTISLILWMTSRSFRSGYLGHRTGVVLTAGESVDVHGALSTHRQDQEITSSLCTGHEGIEWAGGMSSWSGDGHGMINATIEWYVRIIYLVAVCTNHILGSGMYEQLGSCCATREVFSQHVLGCVASCTE